MQTDLAFRFVHPARQLKDRKNELFDEGVLILPRKEVLAGSKRNAQSWFFDPFGSSQKDEKNSVKYLTVT